jgi:hypothetical protein
MEPALDLRPHGWAPVAGGGVCADRDRVRGGDHRQQRLEALDLGVAVAHALLLVGLAGQTPLLADADEAAFLDLDDTIRETHGYANARSGTSRRRPIRTP